MGFFNARDSAIAQLVLLQAVPGGNDVYTTDWYKQKWCNGKGVAQSCFRVSELQKNLILYIDVCLRLRVDMDYFCIHFILRSRLTRLNRIMIVVLFFETATL